MNNIKRIQYFFVNTQTANIANPSNLNMRKAKRLMFQILCFALWIVFFLFSISFLNLSFDRFVNSFVSIGNLFINRYSNPDIGFIMKKGYISSIIDTVQMAYLSTFIGVILSVPIAWIASYNITPNRFAYKLSRALIIICRSVHEIIWCILFIMILGYGMLPGIIALVLSEPLQG